MIELTFKRFICNVDIQHNSSTIQLQKMNDAGILWSAPNLLVAEYGIAP